MAELRKNLFQFFDRQQDLTICERRLPHWLQAGTLIFITWRTWDSMPKAVIEGWLLERNAYLRDHGVDPESPVWREDFARLPANVIARFHEMLSERWQEQLDTCHGSCVFRQPELAAIVADSLNRFDGERYLLTDFVVMPNHVHLLVAFANEDAMLTQCESWKRFTATQIDRVLRRTGRFWQQDGFDHLVRSAEQFDYYRDYIAQNPIQAGLPVGQYLHESKDLFSPPPSGQYSSLSE